MELKFRAWDKIEKKMWIPAIYMGVTYAYNGIGGFVVMAGELADPVMQYTGLKGIYSDDIISDNVGEGVVEYVDDKCAFRINYRNGRAKWIIDFLDSELKSIEIIGNIHQNPELLEQK